MEHLPQVPASKVVEVRLNKFAVNLASFPVTFLCCAAGVCLARILPHYRPFAQWHVPALFGALLMLVPVHEAMHAVGLRRFAKVSWREIRFGMLWRALVPYCHCTVPIPLPAYCRMSLLPLWTTGAASLVALLIFPADWLAVLAGLAIGCCIGDVWLVAKARHFDENALVQDSTSEIGFDVLSAVS